MRFVRTKFSKAHPTATAPNVTKKKVLMTCIGDPIIKIPGFNTNAQGTRKAAKARRMARKPVLNGLPPEIPAAI